MPVFFVGLGAGLAASVAPWISPGRERPAIRSRRLRFLARRGSASGPKISPAEIHDPLDYFLGGLADAQDLPGGQRDHRIRRHVDVLDQVGVQHQRRAVQPGQMDHRRFRGTYRRGRVKTLIHESRGPIRETGQRNANRHATRRTPGSLDGDSGSGWRRIPTGLRRRYLHRCRFGFSDCLQRLDRFVRSGQPLPHGTARPRLQIYRNDFFENAAAAAECR